MLIGLNDIGDLRRRHSGMYACLGCFVTVEGRCRSTWTGRTHRRAYVVLVVTGRSVPATLSCPYISPSFTRPASAAASAAAVSAADNTSPSSTPASSTAAPTTSDVTPGRPSGTPWLWLLKARTRDAWCWAETVMNYRTMTASIQRRRPTTKRCRLPTSAREHFAVAASERGNWHRRLSTGTPVRINEIICELNIDVYSLYLSFVVKRL